MTGRVHGSWTMEDRYRLANYWWVVSEVIRRHPELELEETHPMDGLYDCLTIHGASNGEPVHIDLNRNGSVHVHPGHIGFVRADEFFTEADPHAIVKRIERAAGLTSVPLAPPSAGRTLVYRVLARALAQLVTDRSYWDVRALTTAPHGHSVFIPVQVASALDASPLPDVFPAPADFEAFVVGARLHDGPRPGRFWAILRNGDVVAVLDTRGIVHTSGSRIELEPLYERVGRSLTQTVAVALASLLS